jgi:hypothetical protein
MILRRFSIDSKTNMHHVFSCHLGRPMMRRLLILMFFGFMSFPAFSKEEGPDLLGQTFAWWKAQTEAVRVQVAPRLMEAIGNSAEIASLSLDAADNASRYRALCARDTGSFRESELCRGLQFRFGERSPWSTVFLGLVRRAGTDTASARDAAAILAGLRRELGLDKRGQPARPQHLIRGLYDQFGRCAPPSCKPGLEPVTELRALLVAAVGLLLDQGNDVEVSAARHLLALGWRSD